jgi:hypothetical protein
MLNGHVNAMMLDEERPAINEVKRFLWIEVGLPMD